MKGIQPRHAQTVPSLQKSETSLNHAENFKHIVLYKKTMLVRVVFLGPSADSVDVMGAAPLLGSRETKRPMGRSADWKVPL